MRPLGMVKMKGRIHGHSCRICVPITRKQHRRLMVIYGRRVHEIHHRRLSRAKEKGRSKEMWSDE